MVKIRPFRYGNKVEGTDYTAVHEVKIRPFRYGNTGEVDINKLGLV